MSQGFKGKYHRQNTLSRFAKNLVRRSRSHCELCDINGAKLGVYELLPLEETPHPDACIFICENCLKQITKPKTLDPNHWRCLNNALWSEIPAIQVMSFRILKRLTAKEIHWAEELLEHAYLDTEIEEWANQVDL